jgi:hypothetical protein
MEGDFCWRLSFFRLSGIFDASIQTVAESDKQREKTHGNAIGTGTARSFKRSTIMTKQRLGLVAAFAVLGVAAVSGWMRKPSPAPASYSSNTEPTASPGTEIQSANGTTLTAPDTTVAYDQYGQPIGLWLSIILKISRQHCESGPMASAGEECYPARLGGPWKHARAKRSSMDPRMPECSGALGCTRLIVYAYCATDDCRVVGNC